MRKYFAIFLVALFFFWGVSRLALAITLNTYSDVVNNGAISGGVITLNAGNFDVPSSNGATIVINAAGSPPVTSLAVGAANDTAVAIGFAGSHNIILMRMSNFSMEEGPGLGNSLEVYGGSSTSAYALFAIGTLSQSGGIIIAKGSATATASGIWASNLTQTAGSTGAINATGGGVIGSNGITLGNALTQHGGDITAEGGSGVAAYGLMVGIGLTQSGGAITATGGSAATASGLWAGNLTQAPGNTGTITATGGSAVNAHGIAVGSGLVQNGGAITAQGSATAAAYGLRTINLTQAAGNTGNITATGGGATGASGLVASNLVQAAGNTGTISVRGGSADNANGLFVVNALAQHGGAITAEGGGANANGLALSSLVQEAGNTGTISARGGSGVGAHGVHVGDTLSQSDGAITAEGGGGADAYGLSAGDLIQNNGVITAAGGSGVGAYGLYAGGLTQEPGNLNAISATGGSAVNAHGIFVDSLLSQNGGAITATGGSAAGAHGLFVGNALTQSRGVITATGGGAAGAYGLWAANLTQGGGAISGGGVAGGSGLWAYNPTQAAGNTSAIYAQGGGAAGAYGLYIRESAQINDWLEMTDQAVYVENQMAAPTALNFGSDSLLVLSPGPNAIVPLLQVGSGNVAIAPGAKLIPDVSALRVGQTFSGVFMDAPNGSINGRFTLLNSSTLDLVANKSADNKQYFIDVTREAMVSQALNFLCASNASAMASALQRNLATLPQPLLRFLGRMDFLSGRNLIDFAEYGVPGQATFYGPQAVRTLEVLRDLFLNNLWIRYATPPAGETGGDWKLWGVPFMQFGKQNSKSVEFGDTDQNLYGLAMGLNRNFRAARVGASFHYVRGEIENNLGESDSDLFGFTVGGAYQFAAGGPFAPWLAAYAGYSRQDMDQSRRSINPDTMTETDMRATPAADLWYSGLKFSNSFEMSRRLTLTPYLGLGYALVDISAYKEHGRGGLALYSDPENYESLQFTAGLSADIALGASLDLVLHADYGYEFLDTQAAISSNFVAAPEVIFTTRGQDLSPHSGNAGLNLDWAASEALSLDAGYNFHLADDYQDHNINVGFKYTF